MKLKCTLYIQMMVKINYKHGHTSIIADNVTCQIRPTYKSIQTKT